MADEFLDAIMQRTGGAGFDIQYSNKYNRPTLEKLAANVRAKMDIASKSDRPAKRKRKTRTENFTLTPEEQAYKDYDDARQKLTTFLGETLNTPKGVSNKTAALTEIVDAVSRGRREAGYGTQQPTPTVAATAATTPEFDGKALSRALIEAPPVPSPETAPRTAGGEALSKALIEAPPVQSAETAPRTADVEAAYKEIEAGNVPKAIVVDESKLEAEPVELDENRMAQLYRKTTGSVYNPEVSKAAREKMAQLKAFVSTNPEMLNKSDTRIALDFYRTLK
jgi:hypothetical protein